MTEQAQVLSALDAMRGGRVLIVGDAMLDHYVVGAVDRISPEAPVPVVRVSEERHLMGGACNVAGNIAGLGGDPTLLSYVGADSKADTLRRLLDQRGIAYRLRTVGDRPTTEKVRVLAQSQQVVRIDYEDNSPLGVEDREAILDDIFTLAPEYEVLILSDYGKGLVSPEFMEGLQFRLQALPKAPKVVVDPKTRNFSLYSGVYALTPNAKEAAEGAGLERLGGRMEIIKAGLGVFKKTKCQHLLVTLGADGMAVFQDPGAVWHIPTTARRVFDVTGAGDTVIAALSLAVATGADFLTAAVLANYAAGIVVGEVGTSCCAPENLREAIAALPTAQVNTWLQERL